ncbi:MAG: type II toxin-antitoxin system prevent-host-death family antitoxin [Aromatoleum sp.]|jgi:prevent-host-death family protein|uniref:type II toxin-antitoxin system Phd/YefM family antitoxin n=1 Tax=Aromatoleum sp. TaxID=2307007 RepID=UPI002893EDDD|nr:type II toxin-antitoxin system prevent-host-death family antitoxin [Aromatoleum sp.]MDT3672007.1 type II toxin-antitoxin system prevent-host-death family antitoxin [Aromatoleum sp.]
MHSVPIYDAKNRFSELVAAVERGDEVSITRRGVPVAKLVAASAGEADADAQRTRVAAALAALRKLREHVELEGNLKEIARAGLD